MEKKIKAVIFDMDGTLIDTEKYHVSVGIEVLKEMGYEMSREIMLTFRSLNRKFAKPAFKKLYGEDFDVEYFYRVRNRRVEKILREEGLKKKAGADELLEYLARKDYCVAVATAAELDRALRSLKEVGLDEKFQRIISGHNVENGKPKPDIYIEVCHQLGMAPEECLAVEDSDNGVRSAYGAGLRVVMVPDLAPPGEEVRPMIYGMADSLVEVKKYL